ncbi:MAG: Panacea domain-containing protein [Kiritimatiellaeota bacterium]|nr:Panacea domain-containing protein [Kiritimatiellota bacterium]
MCIHLTFDSHKATQLLNHFAIRNGGTISKYKALKLVFFADRYHLRKYGRPVTCDEYYAMKKGPVPSGTKNLAEMAEDYIGDDCIAYASGFIAVQASRSVITSVLAVDDQQLSESDREALEFAWSTFGKYGDGEIVEQTHSYPEWSKHAAALEKGGRARMDLMDFLKDPPAGADPCWPLSEEDRAIRQEQLRELDLIEAMWS